MTERQRDRETERERERESFTSLRASKLRSRGKVRDVYGMETLSDACFGYSARHAFERDHLAISTTGSAKSENTMLVLLFSPDASPPRPRLPVD